MNIFVTSCDPMRAAISLPDKLLVKMVVETAQILSTVHRKLDGDQYADKHNLYQKTHENHPVVLWTASFDTHYWWLYIHFLHLLIEYDKRYCPEDYAYNAKDVKHKSAALVEPLATLPRTIPLMHKDKPEPYMTWQDFPLCMPDEYKVSNTGWPSHIVTESYQNYLNHGKDYINNDSWAHGRKPPTWFINRE